MLAVKTWPRQINPAGGRRKRCGGNNAAQQKAAAILQTGFASSERQMKAEKHR